MRLVPRALWGLSASCRSSRAVSRGAGWVSRCGGGWVSRCGGGSWSRPLQRVLKEIGSVHISSRGRAETCLSPLKVTPRSTPEPEPWAVAARVTGTVLFPPLCAHGGPASFCCCCFVLLRHWMFRNGV